ncbi:MAG: hypothetical protein LBQ86_06615 [Holophagales bacterium]|jgi:hypothetical protein|nr:hypothetical protein [Holophagales bacterium]
MLTLFLTAALTNAHATIQAQAPEQPALKEPQEPESLEELEYRFLEAYDYDAIIDLPKLPPSRGADQAALQWLHSAAALPAPISPFAPGSPEQGEAAALIEFLNSETASVESGLDKLSLRLSGSQLVLWRFGRANIRSEKWSPATRRRWEDRLLDESSHTIIRGFAARHALCWALAENDENRFADLKNGRIGEDMPAIFGLFQKTFASLGGPLTALRLWSPSLEDISDEGAPGPTIWLCPDPDLTPLSKDMSWIIPILNFSLEDSPEALWKAIAEDLLKSPALADYKVFFAPRQRDLDLLGMALFPALIELDQDGNIERIQMGDACPMKPLY